MPNISLGRPHLPNAHSPAANLAMLTALRQQALAQPMVASGAPSYYNPMAPIDRGPPTGIPATVTAATSDLPPQAHSATTAAAAAAAVTSLPVGAHLGSINRIQVYGQPITDAQVANARLNKQGHRPLGRTQSAPLPLGHPMLTGSGPITISQTHYENSDVS